MQVIMWRVSSKNPILFTVGALITALMAHICCWGPLLLVPLGFGGISYYIGGFINTYKIYFNLLPVLMLTIAGWRTYRKADGHLIEKVIYWISVVVVLILMLQ